MKYLPREIYEKIALVQAMLSASRPNTRAIKLELEWVLEAIKKYETDH